MKSALRVSQGGATSTPSGPGYPSAGCVPAEPASVSPGDNSVRSDSTLIFNLQAGYTYKNLVAQLDVLNLFNSKDHDIDYFYASRLPGEPAAGVEDIHFHPMEPRTVRFYLTYKF